jgi:ribosomal protein S18 acetylase RimI-like enzyme
MEIKRAIELGDDIGIQIGILMVEAFHKDFEFFMKGKNGKENLIKAVSSMFILKYFFLAFIDGEIAGVIGCTDHNSLCINPVRKIFIKHLGLFKGFIAFFIFKKYIAEPPLKKYPLTMTERTGLVEFVATKPKYFKKGVAMTMLNHIHTQTDFDEYVLEVADTNTKAISLYNKMGYKEIARKKTDKHIEKNTGYRYMLYLKYQKHVEINEQIMYKTIIKETDESDLDNILSLWNDGEVMRFVGFPDGLGYDKEKMTVWYESIKQTKRFVHFSIYAEDGVYCGETGYALGKKVDENIGIDIKLLPFAQGKGIAEFSIRYIIEIMKKENFCRTIWVDPHKDNIRAINLYKGLGFEQKTFPNYLAHEDEGNHIYMELTI